MSSCKKNHSLYLYQPLPLLTGVVFTITDFLPASFNPIHKKEREIAMETKRTKQNSLYLFCAIILALALALDELTSFRMRSSMKKLAASTSWSHLLILFVSIVSAACGMEYYSRYTHRYSWHNEKSILYKIHQTHHNGQAKFHNYEMNDVLGILNVIPTLVCLTWSSSVAKPSFGSVALLGMSIGVSIFGTSYMIVHDGVHHGRFRGFESLKSIPKVREILDAHAVHHSGNMGVPFGLFLGPQELEALKRGVEPHPMPWYLATSLVLCMSTAVGGLTFGF